MDGIVTGTIEGGTTGVEGEVAIGTIEEDTFTAQSLTNYEPIPSLLLNLPSLLTLKNHSIELIS